MLCFGFVLLLYLLVFSFLLSLFRLGGEILLITGFGDFDFDNFDLFLHSDASLFDEFNRKVETIKRNKYLLQSKGKDEDFILRNKYLIRDWDEFKKKILRDKLETSVLRMKKA